MTKGLAEEKRSGKDGRQQKSEGLPLSPQYRINGADLCVVTKTVIKTTISGAGGGGGTSHIY